MLILQNIKYLLPDQSVLFENLSLSVSRKDKIALIGNNGIGKSTLLKMIAGHIQPASGHIERPANVYYIPQVHDNSNLLTIASALGIDQKINALRDILSGDVSDYNLDILNDDWDIEERYWSAINAWHLNKIAPDTPLNELSGGQKTKIFLAGIQIHQPDLVLMDEPSNHLDSSSRKKLYEWIAGSNTPLIIVSHDRNLLNTLETTIALKKDGVQVYGGNYDFYISQKELASHALAQNIKSQEQQIKVAVHKQRTAMERQQKLDAKGKKKQEKAGMPTIMQNLMKNHAENSTAKLKAIHQDKIAEQQAQLSALKKQLPDLDKMKFDFEQSALHNGKILFEAQAVNFAYGTEHLWKKDLDLTIRSGDRLAIKGNNGTGKTTLLRIILNEIGIKKGNVKRNDFDAVYIEQDYRSIRNDLTVLEQAFLYNTTNMETHLVKSQLHKFLFTKNDWNKPCSGLSGGEKMKLLLCCIALSNKAPDMIILDEPTNNLDIQNIEILGHVIRHYQGTLIVISHDDTFLESINISAAISL